MEKCLTHAGIELPPDAVFEQEFTVEEQVQVLPYMIEPRRTSRWRSVSSETFHCAVTPHMSLQTTTTHPLSAVIQPKAESPVSRPETAPRPTRGGLAILRVHAAT